MITPSSPPVRRLTALPEFLPSSSILLFRPAKLCCARIVLGAGSSSESITITSTPASAGTLDAVLEDVVGFRTFLALLLVPLFSTGVVRAPTEAMFSLIGADGMVIEDGRRLNVDIMLAKILEEGGRPGLEVEVSSAVTPPYTLDAEGFAEALEEPDGELAAFILFPSVPLFIACFCVHSFAFLSNVARFLRYSWAIAGTKGSSTSRRQYTWKVAIGGFRGRMRGTH